MLNLNTSWFRRTSGSNRTLLTLLHGALLLLCLGAEDFNCAQDLSKKSSQQTADPASAQKSEFIAPGIEHIQIIRGHKSEKEATGTWFINMLRIDLSQARLRLVHAMDEAVGLETVSSMRERSDLPYLAVLKSRVRVGFPSTIYRPNFQTISVV